MPVRWKIFVGLNLILAAWFLLLLGLLCYSVTQSVWMKKEYWFALGFGFCFLVLAVNGFLNSISINRYYPDKSLPLLFSRFHIVVLVFSWLVTIAFVIMLLLANSESPVAGYNKYEKFFFWLCTVATTTQLVVLIAQHSLIRIIRNNAKASMRMMIDNIGSEPAESNLF